MRKKENENVGRGGQLSVARPPRPRHSELKGAAGKRADQPGRVIPGINRRKKIVNVRSRKSTAYTLQRFFECVTDIKHF